MSRLGLFFAIRETTDEIVGTASAVHNPNGGHYHFPFGDEIGYVAVQLEHRGRGLGRALTAAAIADCFRPDTPASVWLLRTTDSRREAPFEGLDECGGPTAEMDNALS